MHYVEWVTTPGLPPVTLDFTTADLNQSSALADDYIFLGGASSPANYTEFDDYYSSLQVVFIERLKARIDDVNLAILEKIDVDLTVTGTLDPEVKERWFPLGIRKNYQPVFDQAHTFISSMGRLKYLTPVYQALLDANRCDLATSWFDENKDFYHPMAVLKIQKLIAPCTEESPEALFMQ
jgi:leukotriene-A4 hydrolase